MTRVERAALYLSKIPPAVSGQGGHDATYHAACVLVQGFGLSEAEAESLMSEYSQRCDPPWSESEIRHKIQSAASAPCNRPIGYLLGKSVAYKFGDEEKPAAHVVKQAKKQDDTANAVDYKLTGTVEMPKPIEGGTMTFLRTLFKPDEGVRIVSSKLNEEQREVPENEGTTLERDKWLSKLEKAGGDPNKIWKPRDKTGIYVTVNPMKPGGSKDSDVLEFRHALIEFDGLPVEQQWELYKASDLPCAAVIASGGKSIHAWVRVDAKDKREYDERVKFLYAHFARYNPDQKNGNPSRLSRLPGCARLNSRQELLALNIGAESFGVWAARAEADSSGELISVERLLNYTAEDDESTLLGDRWVCKGGSLLISGQAGIGKSSLCVQAATLWACGRSLYGISPTKPLRSLVIQAENDLGDLAEMFQGVLAGAEQQHSIDERERALIFSNLIFVRERVHVGEAFAQMALRRIEAHKPDLVWIDPLYTFIGDDISSQRVCSEFLCEQLGPISERTGVAWMVMHHTGKPPTDKQARKGWTNNDWSYSGIGSSVITNWARAIIALEQVPGTTGLFQLILAKRGKRAMAREADGIGHATTVYLEHAKVGIYWQQVDEAVAAQAVSDAEDSQGSHGRKRQTSQTQHRVASSQKPGSEPAKEVERPGRPSASLDVNEFIAYASASLPMTKASILESLMTYARCSEKLARRRFLPQVLDRLEFDPFNETYEIKNGIKSQAPEGGQNGPF